MRARTTLALAAVPLLAALPFLHLGMRSASVKGSSPSVLLAALPFLDLGTKALWIPFWPCPPRTVHAGSSCAFSGPEHPATQDLAALSNALVCGDPPPPGFTASRRVKREIARTTGAIDWFGRHEIEVSVTDGVETLHSARLYVGHELSDEATRENGGIVDRAGEAEATLRFFLPWLPPYTVTLLTEDREGSTEESSISLGCVSPRSR